ncbi:MAG: hypothetical protein F2817_07375 [Actinobacteria bacterium]|nr:hypothetical protein [Actinomycetota bacterium]
MSSLEDVFQLAAAHIDRHECWPSELRLDAPRFHALAREVAVEDFERICVHLRLRVRQTPGASVGGRSVIQLAEAEAPPALARERAERWLGVRAAEHPGPPTFGDAFFPLLTQWGLRGDPHLWNELRRRFAGRPIPTTDDETAAVVLYAVAEIIGCDLRGADEHVPVPSLAIGSGMSD